MTSISSSFAAPSTGGACSRTSQASPRLPATPDRAARGITRTLMTTVVAFVEAVMPERISASFRT
jgi:hypothetical protein